LGREQLWMFYKYSVSNGYEVPSDESNTLQGLYPRSELHIGDEDKLKRCRLSVIFWYQKLAKVWRGRGILELLSFQLKQSVLSLLDWNQLWCIGI